MKVALVTDTHYGARNDAPHFYDYFQKSNDVFFNTLAERGISHIVHLGDLFDRRKYINFVTAKRARQDFLDRVNLFDFKIITGNHDVYFKNTNEVNSLDEMLRSYGSINIYTNPTEINLGGTDVLLLPWICADNAELSNRMISDTKAQVCFGHLELAGFEMHKGTISIDGLDRRLFNKFDLVASGHFHHKSTADNINYLGAAYELNWSDYNDPRGFHIFDTETRSLEFIQNPYSIFKMIVYDDTKIIVDENYEYLRNCYVKVVVLNKTNPYLFDIVLDRISLVSPADISVIEDLSAFGETDDSSEINQTEDTITILNNYIGSLTLSLDQDKLKSMMKNIYDEAQTLSNVE